MAAHALPPAGSAPSRGVVLGRDLLDQLLGAEDLAVVEDLAGDVPRDADRDPEGWCGVQPGPLAEPATEGLRVADPRPHVDAAGEAALVEPAARLRVARDVRRPPPQGGVAGV